MSTTFMSRAKAAMAALVATVVLALGVSALAPSNAQAITATNGAIYKTVTFDKWTTLPDSYHVKLAYEQVKRGYYDSEGVYSVCNHHLVKLIVQEGGESFYFGNFASESAAKKAEYRYISLANHDSFVRILKGSGVQLWNLSGNDYCDECGYDGIAYHVDVPSAPFGGTKAPSISKLNGSKIYLGITRVDTKTFKSGYRTFTYKAPIDMATEYNGFSTTYTATPASTTKWRPVSKTMTAYTTSACSAKKFTLKKGAKVQVKKIKLLVSSFDGSGSVVYYVKNKSGKYGWITGPDLYGYGD